MLAFNGDRLTIARQYRCLTIEELSKKTGISTATIRKHESGKGLPTKENQKIYSQILNFPDSFWAAECVEPLDVNNVSFRSFKRVPAWVKGRAVAEAQIAVDIILKWLNKRFYLPDVSFCQLPEKMSPDEAAKYLRTFWDIGCLPVEHLFHFLEGKGIRIFSFTQNIKSLDACSFWTQDDQPVILIDNTRSGERVRFSLMHEIGHLLMHKDNLVHNKEEEEEADAFASSFLMPQPVFSQNAPTPEKYDLLVAYKHYWGVSMSALIYRMHKLKLISDWNYRSKMVSLSKEVGRCGEPAPIQPETPSLWLKVVEVLKKHGETSISLALELGIPDDTLRGLCFGLPGETLLQIVRDSTEPVYAPYTNRNLPTEFRKQDWQKDDQTDCRHVGISSGH